jgi:hypothetical protein
MSIAVSLALVIYNRGTNFVMNSNLPNNHLSSKTIMIDYNIFIYNNQILILFLTK